MAAKKKCGPFSQYSFIELKSVTQKHNAHTAFELKIDYVLKHPGNIAVPVTNCAINLIGATAKTAFWQNETFTPEKLFKGRGMWTSQITVGA